jgi:hypothetical protein
LVPAPVAVHHGAESRRGCIYPASGSSEHHLHIYLISPTSNKIGYAQTNGQAQSRTMAPYQYQPLDMSKKEIRILHLHSGSREDPIQLSIEHIPFDPSKDDEPFRINQKRLHEIQRALPKDWKIHSTLEGRPIFLCNNGYQPPYTSWQSPISTSNETHSKEVGYGRTGYRIAFEAVSYTWGSAQPLSDVTVMDAQSPCMHIGTCSVGPNLLELLKHLRRPDNTRAMDRCHLYQSGRSCRER